MREQKMIAHPNLATFSFLVPLETAGDNVDRIAGICLRDGNEFDNVEIADFENERELIQLTITTEVDYLKTMVECVADEGFLD